MPADNRVVEAVRIELGLACPTLEAQVQDYKDLKENEARDRCEIATPHHRQVSCSVRQLLPRLHTCC